MIRELPPHILQTRSRFLQDIRTFFYRKGYTEIETPLYNDTGNFEPFIDPFKVKRSGIQKSPEAKARNDGGYLITSPEYNLKIVMQQYGKNIFQIAHVFREGDMGTHHTEEFLMLEWYRIDADDQELMNECRELLLFLSKQDYSRTTINEFYSSTVEELFERHFHASYKYPDIENIYKKFFRDPPESLRYEEIFFSLFLNYIEPALNSDQPHFVYHYPPQLAALSRIIDDHACRFEIYWKGVELANGYYELIDPIENIKRFEEDNRIRRSLGKPLMQPDRQFVDALQKGLPDCSGIALGLERLLMVLLGESEIKSVSPFY